MAPRAPVSKLKTPGFVYFIRAVPDGPIKIGWSTKPTARLAMLQTLSPAPLELLHSMPGDCRLEDYFHRKFAAHRIHGEWFRGDQSLLEQIASGQEFAASEEYRQRFGREPSKPKGPPPTPRLWLHKNQTWYVCYGHRLKRRVSTGTADYNEAQDFLANFVLPSP